MRIAMNETKANNEQSMKKFISTICLMMVTLCVATSCLKDDEKKVEAPQCAITSFKVGDIKSRMTIQKADGTDSTFTVSVSGSTILFNIDQLNNRIETVDSLPSWLDISRVVPTVSSNGYVYVQQDAKDLTFTTFTSGKDSIDFTQPVHFLCVSFDGGSTKTYEAFMHQGSTDSDSLYWTTPTETAMHPVNGPHRSVVLGNRVLVFSENGGNPTVTSTAADGTGEWSEPTSLTGTTSALNYASVTVFGNHLYALDTEGHLCQSDENGTDWEAVGDRTFIRLLSADATYLYAADATGILSSADLENWQLCGTTDLEMLPNNPISSAYYDTRTNTALQNVVMMGLSPQNTENAVVWYKVSSSDEQYNQPWNYISITPDNSYGMPYLQNVQMLRFNNALLAFGAPYDALYRSFDNGISWHKVVSLMALPTDLKNSTRPTSAFVADGKIWILQSGGKLWKGSMK